MRPLTATVIQASILQKALINMRQSMRFLIRQSPRIRILKVTSDVIQEDDNYLFVNDNDQISFPSTLSSSHRAEGSEDAGSILGESGEAQKVIEHTNSHSGNTDMEGSTSEVIGTPEDGLNRGRKDGETSAQEEDDLERDSDFEFPAEDAVETCCNIT
jgi:hypothetical protein